MDSFTSPTTADWAQVDFLNEIALAIQEREAVLNAVKGWSGGSALDLFEAGDDVQAASLWAGLQSRVEALAASGHWLPAGGGLPDRDATAYTWATLRSAAGMGTSWKAKDVDDVVVYRQMEAGDVLGAWIFEELQACLGLMLITTAGVASAVGTGESSTSESISSTREDNIALCEAAAAADNSDVAHAFRECQTFNLPYPPFDRIDQAYQGRSTAIFSRASAGGIAVVSWDLWINAVADGTFDAAGTGWSEGWNKVATGLSAGATSTQGPSAYPSWPATYGRQGLVCTPESVVQWSFSHGF